MVGVWLWGAPAPWSGRCRSNDGLVMANFSRVGQGKVRFGEAPKPAREGACATQAGSWEPNVGTQGSGREGDLEMLPPLVGGRLKKVESRK